MEIEPIKMTSREFVKTHSKLKNLCVDWNGGIPLITHVICRSDAKTDPQDFRLSRGFLNNLLGGFFMARADQHVSEFLKKGETA